MKKLKEFKSMAKEIFEENKYRTRVDESTMTLVDEERSREKLREK